MRWWLPEVAGRVVATTHLPQPDLVISNETWMFTQYSDADMALERHSTYYRSVADFRALYGTPATRSGRVFESLGMGRRWLG